MSTNQRALADADKRYIVHPHTVVGQPPEPLIIDRAEGALVWDVDGKEYVDGTCGLWQCAVGHGRRELADVAAEQMAKLEFYPSFWDYSNEPAIKLAERLVQLSPEGLNKVFFTNGGSEGTETAIKLARLAHHANGQPERTVILSRESAYHGVSAVSLAATGMPMMKQGFGPQPDGFVHMSVPHARKIGPNATDVLVAELEETIERIGADKIAAFIGEPVLGVGGMVPPPDGYWPRVAEVLRKHGILLILDEIVTAFGRTGYWFAAERYGVTPDLLVTAKGLSSGYIPMGAVLIGDQVIRMAHGATFWHGFTYNGHPVGAAVSLANLDIIEREGLPARAQHIGTLMLEALEPLADLPEVLEVRGAGLALGIEFDGIDAAAIAASCREDGVIVRAGIGRIVLSPPLVITEGQAAAICTALEKHITAAIEK
ncbi:aspartate aminotransferase family protein [Nonomuraea sp. NPDC050153]|uniref:aspartate aminotransferase family protein n=1 Tax=Nonomuraea sp. NPDC050153 TaxID=3364359 RepID=UPI0037ABAE7A